MTKTNTETAGIEVSQGEERCVLQGWIADVIAYLLSYGCHIDEEIEYDWTFVTDPGRLLCLLFLIDCRYALLNTDTHETLTGGTWYRGLQGPYIKELTEMVKESRSLTEYFRYDFATPAILCFDIRKNGDGSETSRLLTDKQKEVIRHTSDSFRNTGTSGLIDLVYAVYATDPMINAELFGCIDITKFAARHVRLYGPLEPEIKRKTTEELEAEFADVMNRPAITNITKLASSEEGTEFDPEEFKRRVRQYALEMREVMREMFGECGSNSEADSAIIDSPSQSEGPDKILDASLSSFPPGYFDGLFGEDKSQS